MSDRVRLFFFQFLVSTSLKWRPLAAFLVSNFFTAAPCVRRCAAAALRGAGLVPHEVDRVVLTLTRQHFPGLMTAAPSFASALPRVDF